MGDSLQGQRVVVIGGTSGIGFGVASAAKEAGASVVVASSRKEKVEAAVARLGPGAQGAVIDTGSEDDVASAFAELGAFDHLVYTAGNWDGRPTDMWDLEAGQWIFRIRFWGALRAIKHARQSISSSGSITLTSGVAAHKPRPGNTVTSAGAAAIENLARGLAVDLAPIRVNCVSPGYILTEALEGLEDAIRPMTARQPVARMGEPGEIAQAYLYFMRGTYTTGTVAIVDGGQVLR
ncbi:MAG: SDR family oxidoreductase [Dehalococcoidia bacterium]|nr:SDR family oxidoreductase [Dehalococcoidia bacterium]